MDVWHRSPAVGPVPKRLVSPGGFREIAADGRIFDGGRYYADPRQMRTKGGVTRGDSGEFPMNQDARGDGNPHIAIMGSRGIWAPPDLRPRRMPGDATRVYIDMGGVSGIRQRRDSHM